MFERFSDGARRVVVLAQEEARLLNHSYIGTEHVVLGLLKATEGVAAEALEGAGIAYEAARAQVQEIIGGGPQVPSGHMPFTPRAKRVLELSLREALQLGHSYIGTEHILLGVVREGEGVGAQVLVALGASLQSVRESVLELLAAGAPQERTVGPWPPRVDINEPLVRSAQLRVAHPIPFQSATDQCWFCSRDLWEVDRYVRGETGVICDACVAACQSALDASAKGERAVTLPARMFGPDPDDPAAGTAIAFAFEQVFGGQGTLETRMQLMEDGEVVAPFMTEAAARAQPMAITAVRVSRIRLLGSDRAEVRFTIELGGGPGGITRDGIAIRRDGSWLVSRTTIAALIAPTGVHVPPPT